MEEAGASFQRGPRRGRGAGLDSGCEKEKQRRQKGALMAMKERNAWAERADRKESSGLWACTQANTHTHVVWRFCCFLSFNQTVHEKQEEKEEELSAAGVGWGGSVCKSYHVCSHSHTHSQHRTLPRTGRQRRHTHTHWLGTPGHADTHRYTHRQMHMQVLWDTVVHRRTRTHTQVSKSSDPELASHPLLQARPLSIHRSPDRWCQQKHRTASSGWKLDAWA